jgi:hypothetical protein
MYVRLRNTPAPTASEDKQCPAYFDSQVGEGEREVLGIFKDWFRMVRRTKYSEKQVLQY